MVHQLALEGRDARLSDTGFCVGAMVAQWLSSNWYHVYSVHLSHSSASEAWFLFELQPTFIFGRKHIFLTLKVNVTLGRRLLHVAEITFSVCWFSPSPYVLSYIGFCFTSFSYFVLFLVLCGRLSWPCQLLGILLLFIWSHVISKSKKYSYTRKWKLPKTIKSDHFWRWKVVIFTIEDENIEEFWSVSTSVCWELQLFNSDIKIPKKFARTHLFTWPLLKSYAGLLIRLSAWFFLADCFEVVLTVWSW